MPGGWSDAKVERMRNAQIPQMLTCIGCNKTRSQAIFSNAQITRLKGKLMYSKDQKTLANHGLRCRYCTGELSEEITCVSCRKSKLKEQFFKSQRSNLDTATCINCVADAQSSRPWDANDGAKGSDDEYDDDDDDDDDSTTVGPGSTVGGVPVSSSDGGDEVNETSSMSSRPSVPSSMGIGHDDDDDYDEDDSESVGGAFLEDDPSQRDTSSIVYSSAVSSSTANEHSQVSTLSKQASVQGDYGWQLKENRSRPRPAASSKPGKWAKIRAHNPYRHAQNMRIPEPPEIAADDDQHSQIGTSVAPSESYF
ncbi:hypothetical protein PISL3812_08918 [Talaromyces islandicus]|uniref:Stc1 domain-containing protein n=1 Tax=Talaromyces islandicus TaxID=28573 RepID=A0A0U1M8A2_TALIS|nr:hypothetical protein PISL3812_08918 [Talaromyces islandicus]